MLYIHLLFSKTYLTQLARLMVSSLNYDTVEKGPVSVR